MGETAGVPRLREADVKPLSEDEIRDIIEATRAGKAWCRSKGHAPFCKEDFEVIRNVESKLDDYWADNILPVTACEDIELFTACSRKTACKASDWPEDTWVRASDLAAILGNPAIRSVAKPEGVSFAGLRIAGNLNLYNIALFAPLRLRGCRIEGDIILRHAETDSIDLRGSFMHRMEARRIKVDGDMFATGTSFLHGLFLEGAEIEGLLNINRANMRAKSPEDPDKLLIGRVLDEKSRDGVAFRCDAAKIGHSLAMEGICANGGLLLDNADIRANLIISHAQVEARLPLRNRDHNSKAPTEDERTSTKCEGGFYKGYAIKAMDLSVAGTLDCQGSTFFGDVRMLSLNAGGSVLFEDVTICGSDGRSLLLDFAQVAEDLLLRGLQAYGTIRMRKLVIDGDLRFTHSKNNPVIVQGAHDYEEADVDAQAFGRAKGMSLTLAGATINGDLQFMGRDTPLSMSRFDGELELRNAVIGRRFRMRACYLTTPREEGGPLVSGAFLKVGGDILFRGIISKGPIDIEDIDVRGGIRFLSMEADSHDEKTVIPCCVDGLGGDAINLRRARLGSGLHFDTHDRKNKTTPAFIIQGTTRFTNATIGGQVIFGTGWCFAGRPRLESGLDLGVAIGARAAKIERGIYIGRGFRAIGEVRFIEAKINDDVTFNRATIMVDANHIREHPYAVRFERAEIDGKLTFGRSSESSEAPIPGQFNTMAEWRIEHPDEFDPDDFSTSAPQETSLETETDDNPKGEPHPWKDPIFVSRGGISLTGAQIDGALRFLSAQITSLSAEARPDITDPEKVEGLTTTIGELAESPRVRVRAIEASLLVVAKDLEIGGINRPVFIDGQMDVSGSRIEGSMLICNTLFNGPQEDIEGMENAFRVESLSVGLNCTIRHSIFIAGAAMRQTHVRGSCHIDNCTFIAADLLAGSKWRPRDHKFDLLHVDPGEIALTTLRATFGRSLKIRHTTFAYGVVQVIATTVNQDFEFWLKNLRQLSDRPKLEKELLARCERFDAILERFACKIDGLAEDIQEPSLFAGNRATVGGTFFLGHPADDMDDLISRPDSSDKPSTLSDQTAAYRDSSARNSQTLSPKPAPQTPQAIAQAALSANTSNSEPKKSPTDENQNGYLDFTDMLVHTLRDSEASWPYHGRLVLNGFYYDRIDQYAQGVPTDCDDRIAWLKRTEPGEHQDHEPPTPDLAQKRKHVPLEIYEQLTAAYQRMGRSSDAEYVDQRKLKRRYWQLKPHPFRTPEASSNHALPRWKGLVNTVISFIFLPLRSVIWLIYGHVMRYGYQHWRALTYLVAVVTLGTIISGLIGPASIDEEEHAQICGDPDDPTLAIMCNSTRHHMALAQGDFQRAALLQNSVRDHGPATRIMKSCIIPDTGEYYSNYLISEREGFTRTYQYVHAKYLHPNGLYYNVSGYTNFSAWRYFIDRVIPIDLGMASRWAISDSDECRIAIPGTKIGAHYLVLEATLVWIGTILFLIVAALATGFMRPNVKPPQQPSRFGGTEFDASS